MKNLDEKIQELLVLNGNEFIFVEYYSHTNEDMYKINNIHTNYNNDKLVLCGVDEGFEHAVDLALESIEKIKAEFWGDNKKETI